MSHIFRKILLFLMLTAIVIWSFACLPTVEIPVPPNQRQVVQKPVEEANVVPTEDIVPVEEPVEIEEVEIVGVGVIEEIEVEEEPEEIEPDDEEEEVNADNEDEEEEENSGKILIGGYGNLVLGATLEEAKLDGFAGPLELDLEDGKLIAQYEKDRQYFYDSKSTTVKVSVVFVDGYLNYIGIKFPDMYEDLIDLDDVEGFVRAIYKALIENYSPDLVVLDEFELRPEEPYNQYSGSLYLKDVDGNEMYLDWDTYEVGLYYYDSEFTYNPSEITDEPDEVSTVEDELSRF